MHAAITRRLAAALAAAVMLAPPAFAQKEYEPQVGQAGKDLIWVPTADEIVERMLRMAQTTAQDYVIDLGAGDGKIVIAAAGKFGARALGIEYNPELVAHARRNADKAGVLGKAQIVEGDIFVTDFSQATVLTLYLVTSLNLKLRPIDTRHAAGDARRVARVRHGRLGSGRSLHYRPPAHLFLGRARERAGRLVDGDRRRENRMTLELPSLAVFMLSRPAPIQLNGRNSVKSSPCSMP
jgi:hypothetical protein